MHPLSSSSSLWPKKNSKDSDLAFLPEWWRVFRDLRFISVLPAEGCSRYLRFVLLFFVFVFCGFLAMLCFICLPANPRWFGWMAPQRAACLDLLARRREHETFPELFGIAFVVCLFFLCLAWFAVKRFHDPCLLFTLVRRVVNGRVSGRWSVQRVRDLLFGGAIWSRCASVRRWAGWFVK